jgi:hypothetical protein
LRIFGTGVIVACRQQVPLLCSLLSGMCRVHEGCTEALHAHLNSEDDVTLHAIYVEPLLGNGLYDRKIGVPLPAVLHSVQTGPGALPTYSLVIRSSFQWVKRPERQTGHSAICVQLLYLHTFTFSWSGA